MSTASQYFDLYCSQYKDDPNKDLFIESARCRISECFYRKNYELAVALLACHEITLTKTRPLGEGGYNSTKSEGDLSMSFGNSLITTKDNPHLGQTRHGLMLISLRNAKPTMRTTGQGRRC